MTPNGWIGVDLDGTLAYYDKWQGIEHIGAPIPKMVAEVKRWIANGTRVKIFTARANYPEAVPYIENWCLEHLGKVLEVTATKDFAMDKLFDDRAYHVVTNVGLILGD